MEKNECLVIDTLLNLRKIFSGPGERAAARQLLENKKEEEVWLLKKHTPTWSHTNLCDHTPTCGKVFQKSRKRQVQVLQISSQKLILTISLSDFWGSIEVTTTYGGQTTRNIFQLCQNQLSIISVLHLHPPLQSSFSLVLKRYTMINAIDLHQGGQKYCCLSRTIIH